MREYSFLDNPRAPKELIASRRVLQVRPPIDSPGFPWIPHKELIASRRVLQPPASLSADALAMFLTAEMRSVRVLHYEHMPDLYATLPLITLDYP